MHFDNLLEVLVRHFLIGGMTSPGGHWDGFPMVGALVCMDIHQIEPTLTHDIMLSGSHDYTKLLCCIIS